MRDNKRTERKMCPNCNRSTVHISFKNRGHHRPICVCTICNRSFIKGKR